jgi:hypothetical protein
VGGREDEADQRHGLDPSPWVSLPITLVALLALSVYYARRSRSRVGPVLSLLGAAGIAAAMIYLWMRSHP